MRVLLLVTSWRPTPDVQLLLHLTVALGLRGEKTGIACVEGSEVDEAIRSAWRGPLRRTIRQGRRGGLASGVRDIIASLRPDVVLVGSAAEAALASVAMGAHGGVVRRLSLGERADSRKGFIWPFGSWRSRAPVVEWGRGTSPALSWPDVPDTADAETEPAAHEVPDILILPPISRDRRAGQASAYDESTATALRAVAHLRRRYHKLGITLLGDAAELQPARTHAAALGIASGLSIRPLRSLLDQRERRATALWIAGNDDSGALCTVAAMRQGIPVILAHDAPFVNLIEPGMAGFPGRTLSAGTAGSLELYPHPQVPVSRVMQLARLVDDPHLRRTMGGEARIRAERYYSWERFLQQAVTLMSSASGRAPGAAQPDPRSLLPGAPSSLMAGP